ncbi:hypothetical protein Tco_1188491, partial [Tanacetum coccineum]
VSSRGVNDGVSWSMDVDTSESAISTALGAAATGTGETTIVGGLKYSSNKGWNKVSQSSLFGGLQGPEPNCSEAINCMRTRSQARKRRQQQVLPNLVEPPKDTMADNRTMAELLQAPTEGYEDAIVVPEIEAANFEIKHGLLTLVQNKQFFGHDKRGPICSHTLLQ